MSEWDKVAVNRPHTAMDMPCLRDMEERNFLLMLVDIFKDLNEVRTSRLPMLAYGCPDMI